MTSTHTHTQALHLGTNRIADMSDVDKLSALPCLLDLTLANNPIARKQLYRATAMQVCVWVCLRECVGVGVGVCAYVCVCMCANSRIARKQLYRATAIQACV